MIREEPAASDGGEFAGGLARFLARALELHDFLPGHQAQFTVRIFHQRRQALDPVAVVAIDDTADVADLGLVDVAADDAIQALLLGLVSERVFEGGDVVPRILDLGFQVLRKRPVRQPGTRAPAVEPA